MKTKPLTYNIYGSLFLILAVSIPLQISYLYEYHLITDYQGILSKISDFNLLMVGSFLVCAYLFFEAKKYLKYFIPLMSMIVFANNFFVSKYGTDFSFEQTLMSSTLFSLTLGIFYLTKSYDLLFEPAKHWWKTPRRQRMNSKIHVLPSKEYKAGMTLDIFDLSETGMFLYNKTGPIREGLGELNKSIQVSIPFFREPIRCEAKVVRKTEGQGIYPGGIGIQFQGIDFKDKLKLKALMMKEHYLAG